MTAIFQGEINKKRIKAKPHDFTQMSELAFYVATKRKQAVYIYISKEGLPILTTDQNKAFKNKDGVYEVHKDGKLFHTPYVDKSKPVQATVEEAAKVLGPEVKKTRPYNRKINISPAIATSVSSGFSTVDFNSWMDIEPFSTVPEAGEPPV